MSHYVFFLPKIVPLHDLLCNLLDCLPVISCSFDFVFRDKFQNQISQQQQRQSQSPILNNNQNRRNVEVKKKVWSVDTPDQQQAQQTAYNSNGNGHYSSVQQSTNGIDVRSQKEKIYINENFCIIF